MDRTTLAVLAIGAVILGLFGTALNIPRWEREGRERAERVEAEASRAGVIAEAEMLVKARLTDPQSAQFTEVRVLGESIDERVCGLVNAKNKFGGYHGPERFLVMLGSAYIGDERPGPIIWNKPQHPCEAP